MHGTTVKIVKKKNSIFPFLIMNLQNSGTIMAYCVWDSR